jgi:hypothetical protein
VEVPSPKLNDQFEVVWVTKKKKTKQIYILKRGKTRIKIKTEKHFNN